MKKKQAMQTLDDTLLAPVLEIRRRQAEHVIGMLRRRGMWGEYHRLVEDAVQSICRRIPDGATVAIGGSVSVQQSGLLDRLRGMPIALLDRYDPRLTAEQADRIRIQSLSADVFVASSNAVTADGRLINIDGTGNRVSCLIYGPARVILLCGTNKIVATLDDALSRVRNLAAPMNALRLKKDTPCARTGFCEEPACSAPARICAQVTTIEMSRVPDRVGVVFVGEDLGY